MTRQEFDAMLKELNGLTIIDMEEELPEAYWDIFSGANKIDEGLNVDTHRWYELSTEVFSVGEWFVGYRGVSNIFSESMGKEDCGISGKFFEMVPQETVTYIEKTPES